MKWFRRGRVASVLLSLIVTGACSDATSPPPPPSSKPDASAASELPVIGTEVRILALGDSLFTGYGLDNGLSYPARLEAALRARGINARIANAGVSGDTTQGGAARVKFALDGQPQPPALVLISLGGNDMLRGLPPAQTRANLDAILTELSQRKIKAVLLGMLAAPNLGADYAGAFNPIFPELAKKHGAVLVPFFLQPLVNNPGLVQGDRIHPTKAGVEAMVAATIDQVAGAVPKLP